MNVFNAEAAFIHWIAFGLSMVLKELRRKTVSVIIYDNSKLTAAVDIYGFNGYVDFCADLRMVLAVLNRVFNEGQYDKGRNHDNLCIGCYSFQ